MLTNSVMSLSSRLVPLFGSAAWAARSAKPRFFVDTNILFYAKYRKSFEKDFPKFYVWLDEMCREKRFFYTETVKLGIIDVNFMRTFPTVEWESTVPDGFEYAPAGIQQDTNNAINQIFAKLHVSADKWEDVCSRSVPHLTSSV